MISMIERKDIISEYEQTSSIRAVARNLGIHRKTAKHYVNEYLAAKAGGDEVLVAYLKSDPSYKAPQRDRTALTDEVRSLIDTCLRDNEEKRQRGDRKLCMKASDIHKAVGYAGFRVSYSSVCKYIRTTLGQAEGTEECFIRQRYKPGRDCEFDWGEMYLTIDGRRTRLYMAVFTMAYSNYRSAFLFLHQDTQAFLEAHRRFFRELGHVPQRMVYDNMRVAVKSFVGGKHPTDALIRLEAAYGFKHRFCNAHRGNEKGHVERSVEVVRRASFCRVDTFETLTFIDCKVLMSIVIPDSVTVIERGAFRGCTGLTSIVIPDSVTEIGDWAFSGCTDLTNIVIGNSVTEIGLAAFHNCKSLTGLFIPESLTYIDISAFRNCSGLPAGFKPATFWSVVRKTGFSVVFRIFQKLL